jgi:hypothetical protein
VGPFAAFVDLAPCPAAQSGAATEESAGLASAMRRFAGTRLGRDVVNDMLSRLVLWAAASA